MSYDNPNPLGWNGPCSEIMPLPMEIASATTIAPTTKLSIVTGDEAILNITPPFDFYHELIFFAGTGDAWYFDTGGNVAVTCNPRNPNWGLLLGYNPITQMYFPVTGN